ncbi:GntR family transcriptional regulator, partial [Pseudothermotoga sp.]
MIRTIETSKERKANLVAEAIKKMILEENIEKLPGENKLAETFNVSRTIVR